MHKDNLGLEPQHLIWFLQSHLRLQGVIILIMDNSGVNPEYCWIEPKSIFPQILECLRYYRILFPSNKYCIKNDKAEFPKIGHSNSGLGLVSTIKTDSVPGEDKHVKTIF